MADRREDRPVPADGFCRHFDRCDTSLIEEPETCDVCRHYQDEGSRCRRPLCSGEEAREKKTI